MKKIFKLPLSGDVTQWISPLTAFMTGGQFGLININMGPSSEPEVEQEVMADVASYGKQLGRIEDALVVLLTHFRPTTQLTKKEGDAIEALRAMIADIAKIKEEHNRPAYRLRAVAPPS